jgi:outer membrane receptor protein involved in Fe transport
VSLDTSIYRIDWTKIQSGFFLPSCNVPITANFGDARSQGVDFIANFLVTDSTSMGISIGYADAEYTTDTRSASGVILRPKGEPLPIAPWTFAFSGEQGFGVGSHEGYVRADFQFRSHDDTPIRTDVPAIDPTIPRAPQSKNLDLRTGVRFTNGLDLSVFATNVLNDTPLYSRNRDTGNTFNYRAVTVRPFTVGLTATYRF